MASDPELPRFAGPRCRWPKGGQSRIDRQGIAARNSAPWQHLLKEVLHFVCELRGPITPGSGCGASCWLPVFAKRRPVVMGPGSALTSFACPGRREGYGVLIPIAF